MNELRIFGKALQIFVRGVLLLGLSSCTQVEQEKPAVPNQEQTGIYPYQDMRDKEKVLEFFEDNWYWLMANNDSLDPAYFLDHRSPTMNPADHYKEHIAVYREKGKTIGMIAYYPEALRVGRIHFLVIDEPYRGKGYSQKLMEYAFAELRKLGVKNVWLVTRMDNIPAQKLYFGLGFKHVRDNGVYLYLEKTL